MNILKQFYVFINDLLKSRNLIWQMSKQDFRAASLGSYLGMAWAFIQPIVTILVLWFVFSFGFKPGKTDSGCPFILWLMAGMIPWFFISDALLQGAGSIVSYSYLVKKVVFRVSVLPIIKVASSLYIHLFLVVAMLLIFILHGNYPTYYWFQIIYYIFCTIILVISISWMTASLNVFVRDIGQVISVFMQLGFWFTPIIWNFSMVRNNKIIAFVMQLNPAFYIVQGYRNSLINHASIWADWKWMLYFWGVTLCLFVFSAVVFKKLRPHFADVL